MNNWYGFQSQNPKGCLYDNEKFLSFIQGFAYKEIGSQLEIGTEAVRTYVKVIRRKIYWLQPDGSDN